MKIILAIIFYFSFILFCSAYETKEVINKLDDSVHFIDDLLNAPESSLFETDKEDIQNDIDDFLDELFEILEISDAIKHRDNYKKLEEKILDEKNIISELEQEKIFAPEKSEMNLSKLIPDSKYTSSIKEIVAETKSDYQKLINIKKTNIESYENELERIAQSISDALSEKSINLDTEQVKLWLSSAVGDDILSMSVIFSNIKEITIQLEELTKSSGENLNFAKKYYGMVVILHKLIIHMQQKFISKSKNEILPKLSSFQKEAKANLKEAKKLLSQDKSNKLLKANIKSNELTLNAIKLYSKVISNQMKKVKNSLKISKREEKIAINTYKTVKLSSSVTNLIRNGLKTFDTLSKLQVPDITRFENKEMQEEFRKLTVRIVPTS